MLSTRPPQNWTRASGTTLYNSIRHHPLPLEVTEDYGHHKVMSTHMKSSSYSYLLCGCVCSIFFQTGVCTRFIIYCCESKPKNNFPQLIRFSCNCPLRLGSNDTDDFGKKHNHTINRKDMMCVEEDMMCVDMTLW